MVDVHSFGGAPFAQLFSRPVSDEMLSRFGPRNCVQPLALPADPTCGRPRVDDFGIELGEGRGTGVVDATVLGFVDDVVDDFGRAAAVRAEMRVTAPDDDVNTET